MTLFVLGVIASVLTGVLVNEFCDIAPWLAGMVVRRAARTWAKGHAAAGIYEEEWAAVVDDCPGKVTKLALALRFAIGAAADSSWRHLERGWDWALHRSRRRADSLVDVLMATSMTEVGIDIQAWEKMIVVVLTRGSVTVPAPAIDNAPPILNDLGLDLRRQPNADGSRTVFAVLGGLKPKDRAEQLPPGSVRDLPAIEATLGKR
jgi:hypothetical protein